MYAMEQLQAGGASHGTAFFAHHQLAGKGQRGKKWESEPGTQIALSVITDCSGLSQSNPFEWSVAVALAAYDFFSIYAGDETRIKWPNDLYWRDRKAGGILIENVIRGNQWRWAVTGIGININQAQFPDSAPNAVSLRQITGKAHDPAQLARQLCNSLQQQFVALEAGNFATMLNRYQSHLYKLAEPVRLKKGNVVFNTSIEGVSADGRLLVAGGNSFGFGEVVWLNDQDATA